MVATPLSPSHHPLAEDIYRLEAGEALLKDSPDHLLEVVGILASYGIVLDAYSKNLIYMGDYQFLVFFDFFKYCNGEITLAKLLRHWWGDRINYEYAEYTARGMMWHGGGGLDDYLDTPDFRATVDRLVRKKFKFNPAIRLVHRVFGDFTVEHMRYMAYLSGLGQFWRVMSDIFTSLSDRYDRGEVRSLAEVVQHIQDGLVADAARPIVYSVTVRGETFDLLPRSAGLTFLPDTAIPYVEAIFFRGTPFLGTVSYNAQAGQIPSEQAAFAYGALNADPLPTRTAGVPPTLLMQDMRHYVPDYLHELYRKTLRGEGDLLVKICRSFQKSMFCVTTAAIRGLAPHPLETTDPEQQRANRQYLEGWMDKIAPTRIAFANAGCPAPS
ncbi:CO2 hydration protein [Rubidibacter lacunae KORDI 51-2]|uniref:CO2 hydration protein n=1 Tax=Rubidibacter lacunae KORDI 51-2 TaxID=582515 RepID=U5DKI8_9CHRO|nr:CO2 hydration protein [Rubidibacter lacunae]ERN41427.1 CO2 hydration protein [Rubidibacter lacunae KORDI 51-2]